MTSLCRRHRKPFAFLLAAVDVKMPKLTEQAMHMLLRMAKPGGTVMTSRMSYRQGYIQSLAVGRAAHETEKALVGEIDSIWTEVQQRSGQTRKRGRSMKMNAAKVAAEPDIDAEDISYDAQEDWTKAYETLKQRGRVGGYKARRKAEKKIKPQPRTLAC